VSGRAPALGLIAGSGPLPLIAAREAKTRGLLVVAVALREETDPALEGVADRTAWVSVGQLGALLRAFRREGVTEAVMGKGRILVVEDDSDISNMLRIYFTSQGYEVVVAGRGGDALERCRQQLPNVIVLDIMLPDIDGYEVCTQLRTNLRTSHVPIIFLTQKDERSDRIAGLELGADDYITKPFDIEELRLRVQGAMRRAERENLTNPTTGLPSGRLNEEQLRLLMRKHDWGLLYIGIEGLEDFNNAYGFLAGDDVLRFTALLLGETLDEGGAPDDYIGHVGGDKFMAITKMDRARALADALKARFADGILSHYSFIDRDRGYVVIRDPDGKDRQAPLMRMCVGLIRSDVQEFTDIREITEAAAEARRADCASLPSLGGGSPPET